MVKDNLPLYAGNDILKCDELSPSLSAENTQCLVSLDFGLKLGPNVNLANFSELDIKAQLLDFSNLLGSSNGWNMHIFCLS